MDTGVGKGVGTFAVIGLSEGADVSVGIKRGIDLAKRV